MYCGEPNGTGAPSTPATVTQATYLVPSQTQFTAALAIPALAAAKLPASSSETMRLRVMTLTGALGRAWSIVSGSVPPVEASGLMTAFRPRGRLSSVEIWPARATPARPMPYR